MRRQRKNPSSNGMEDASIKELNEMEASKPSDTEFKRPVLRMLKALTENYKELTVKYNNMKKEIKITNKNQEEVKYTISEIKKHTRGNYIQAG